MASRLRDDDSYHGRCVRSLSAAGLLLAERVYPARLEIPLHAHERPYLCAVLRGGCYSEMCGGRTWTCTPRTLFLRPPGEPHANRFGDAGGRVFGVELGPAWSERLAPRQRTLERPASFEGVCAGLARKLHREFRQDDPAAPLIVEGLVLEILGEACRAVPSGEVRVPAWLRRARDILHDRYDRPPGLAEMADEVGVHPLHLARVFRRAYGCSVGEYVRRLRVEFACRELARPSRSLVEIALQAGFCDQSQFCRTFKRHVGLTPSEYRREARAR
jgi:AraC family transcriptional regulator